MIDIEYISKKDKLLNNQNVIDSKKYRIVAERLNNYFYNICP